MSRKITITIIMGVLLLSTIQVISAQVRQGNWNYTSTRSSRPSPEKKPLANDEQEKKILTLLEEIGRTDTSGLIVPLADGRFLRLLAETSNAKNVVEIGTYNGYSAMWFCLGLRATGGKITTFEIDHDICEVARENFKKAGVEDMVTLVEGDAHKTIVNLKGPIDILFIDADKGGYVDYLTRLLPLVRPGGLIIAHNVGNLARDLQGYTDAVTTNPELDSLFFHMDSIGICVSIKKHKIE